MPHVDECTRQSFYITKREDLALKNTMASIVLGLHMQKGDLFRQVAFFFHNKRFSCNHSLCVL